jgi:hypothetical protein
MVWVLERGMRDDGEHVGDRSAVEVLPKMNSHSTRQAGSLSPHRQRGGQPER